MTPPTSPSPEMVEAAQATFLDRERPPYKIMKAALTAALRLVPPDAGQVQPVVPGESLDEIASRESGYPEAGTTVGERATTPSPEAEDVREAVDHVNQKGGDPHNQGTSNQRSPQAGNIASAASEKSEAADQPQAGPSAVESGTAIDCPYCGAQPGAKHKPDCSVVITPDQPQARAIPYSAAKDRADERDGTFDGAGAREEPGGDRGGGLDKSGLCGETGREDTGPVLGGRPGVDDQPSHRSGEADGASLAPDQPQPEPQTVRDALTSHLTTTCSDQPQAGPSAVEVPAGWRLVPTDDIYRGFADSALPEEMILAGAEALDEKDPDIDWDSGMVAVLVYRSMLAASPTCDLARVLSGAETGRVVEMDAALNQLDREHDAEMTDVVVKCFNSLNEADAKRVAAEDRATKLEADLQAVTTEAERLRRINSDHCTAVNTLTIDGARLDRRIAELTAQMPDTGAATDVLAERRRQVEQEGWTPEHDDTHSKGELLDAALCYAQRRSDARLFGRSVELTAPARWPWELTWWKPKDERHDLVKAGALIVAEIERLDRALAALQATATVEG